MPRFAAHNRQNHAPRLEYLIDKLFTSEEDRALARAWAAKLGRDGVGERSEALLCEAARIAQPRRLIERRVSRTLSQNVT